MGALADMRYELFCQHFAGGSTRKDAAAKAGFSQKYARQKGSALMKRPEIQARILELRVEAGKRIGIDAERVLQALGAIAFFDARDLFDRDGHLLDVSDLSDSAAAAVAGLDIAIKASKDGDREDRAVRVKLNDRLKALELLGRHFALFTDRVEVETMDTTWLISDGGA